MTEIVPVSVIVRARNAVSHLALAQCSAVRRSELEAIRDVPLSDALVPPSTSPGLPRRTGATVPVLPRIVNIGRR